MVLNLKSTSVVDQLSRVPNSPIDLQLSSCNLKLVQVLVQETYYISPFKLSSLDSNLKPNFLI
jgi:hypothetical protein